MYDTPLHSYTTTSIDTRPFPLSFLPDNDNDLHTCTPPPCSHFSHRWSVRSDLHTELLPHRRPSCSC